MSYFPLIRSKAAPNLTMNIKGGQVLGANLILFETAPSPNEGFYLLPVSLNSSTFYIINRPIIPSQASTPSLLLDLSGSNVVANSFNGEASQQWQICPDPAGSGYYYFQNVANGLVIDTQNKGTAQLTPLVVDSLPSSGPIPTQLWSTPLPTRNRVSFEVLSQPIAPSVGEEPMPIPYVTQGFFAQVSNLGPSASTISLYFISSPQFVTKNTAGDIVLAANYIDNTGAVTQYNSSTFLTNKGFKQITIPAGGTYLFGVQYLLIPNSQTVIVGGTPQSSESARGVLELLAPVGNNIVAVATVRQVFVTYAPTSTPTDLVATSMTESAYQVPFSNAYSAN
jgi:hypothetical protein